MADDTFRLPKTTYDEMRNIIVAYGHLGEAGSLDDVAQHGGGSRTTVSRVNGFLVSTGIVEGGKKKGTTKLGQQLANALQHDQELPGEVARLWRDVVEGSDFLQKVLAAVRVRKGMERSALESHIAYTAGEKKSSRVMTGAKTVIDILSNAGLIEESDGKLVAASNHWSSDETSQEQPLPPPEGSASSLNPPLEQQVQHLEQLPPKFTVKRRGVSIEIRVDVAVSCSVDELEELGEGLRYIVDQLSEDDTSSPASEDEPES